MNLSVIKNNPLVPYCLKIDIPHFNSLFFIQQFVGQESSVANDTLSRSLPTNNHGMRVIRVMSRKNKESKGLFTELHGCIISIKQIKEYKCGIIIYYRKDY